jgi:hypothetical protein
MFKIETSVVRPDQTAPFYVLKMGYLESDSVMDMLRSSPGFIDHTYEVSSDGLVFHRVTSWQSEEDHYNFLYSWLSLNPDYLTDYNKYNLDNQHMLTTTTTSL